MKNTIQIIALAVLMSLNSCNHEGSYQEDIAMENTTSTTVQNIKTNSPTTEGDAQRSYEHIKIIKTADAKLKVKNIDNCTSKSLELITKWNGYVADMRYTQNDYQLENRMVFKVPSVNFDALLKDLTSLAEFVDYKNISTQDVTAEYVDLTTRLATKKQVKERYDQILRNRAKTVEEVLQTEEKLRVLQEEIEAAEGRLKYLGSQVSLSSIQIDFYQTVEYKKEPESYVITFKDQAVNSLSYGWNFIKGASLVVLTLWPLFFLIPLVVFGVRWYRRK